MGSRRCHVGQRPARQPEEEAVAPRADPGALEIPEDLEDKGTGLVFCMQSTISMSGRLVDSTVSPEYCVPHTKATRGSRDRVSGRPPD